MVKKAWIDEAVKITFHIAEVGKVATTDLHKNKEKQIDYTMVDLA